MRLSICSLSQNGWTKVFVAQRLQYLVEDIFCIENMAYKQNNYGSNSLKDYPIQKGKTNLIFKILDQS